MTIGNSSSSSPKTQTIQNPKHKSGSFWSLRLPLEWSEWMEFLYAESSGRPLAILRIALGSYLVVYWLGLYPFVDIYFFPPAILPRADIDWLPWWSALKLVPDSVVGCVCLFVGTILAALCLAAGLFTRIAAVVTWWLAQSWLAFPEGQNSGDFLVRTATFLMMLAALAGHAQAVLSIDSFRKHATHDNRSIPMWPLRMFQMQLVLMYFFAGVHKVSSVDWYQGEAVYYVLQQTLWRRIDASWIRDPLLIGCFTYGTVVIELFLFPVLIWFRRWKPWVLMAGLLFHFGIWLSTRVFVFGYIVPIYYLSFCDDDFWNRIVSVFQKTEKPMTQPQSAVGVTGKKTQ